MIQYEDDHVLVMLEKVHALTVRMKKILEGSRICIYDSDNENRLFNTIYNVGDKVTLVLLDLDFDQPLAMDLLKETRSRLSNTPIIVIVSAKEKSFFIESLLMGATDFIIKPFDDRLFLSKITKYIDPESTKETEIVSADINKYLTGELRKAEKGNFALSIMFLAVVKGENNSEWNEQKIDPFVYNLIFENMQELFWETDIFIRISSKYYLGVFPFCDEKNTIIVSEKVKFKFQNLKNIETRLNDYCVTLIFVSYPFDTSEKSEMMDIMIKRIEQQSGIIMDI